MMLWLTALKVHPSIKAHICAMMSCDIYTHTPVPKKFYKLPSVLFCCTNSLHELFRALAWV